MSVRSLFSTPEAAFSQNLELASRAVAKVFPLKRAHQEELPYAVRDLSRLLTTERDQKRGYWSAPRLLGAYLYYFLPWNLLRLARLLPELPLNLQAGDRVLDLGSGPLTLPLGLWLAGKGTDGNGLRDLPLELACADTAPRPLELGRDILYALQGLAEPRQAQTQPGNRHGAGHVNSEFSDELGERPVSEKQSDTQGEAATRPWQIDLLRAPLDQALRKIRHVKLICAANVLNELPTPRSTSLEERLGELFASMDRTLAPGGQILLIEPGTRLGGKLVQLMRQQALEFGYEAQSPCPHSAACPLLRQDDDDFPRSGGWCHFVHDTAGAGPGLLRLSAAAKLEKERLSLSFVLLRKPENEVAPNAAADKQSESVAKPESVVKKLGSAAKLGNAAKVGSLPDSLPDCLQGRVVSEQIRLPLEGSGYYVCTAEGLGLLTGAGRLASGALVKARKRGGVDAKTGALKLAPADKAADRSFGKIAAKPERKVADKTSGKTADKPERRAADKTCKRKSGKLT